MTDKYNNFVDALRKLCKEHDVTLSLDIYDNLTVFDYDGEEHLFFEDVVDKTKDE